MQAAPPLPADLETRRGQMFPVLTQAQLERLTACGEAVAFRAGEVLFDEGTENVAFYVVLEGEVNLVHPLGQSEEPIAVLARGQFTGEISLLINRRTLVRARSLSPAKVLRIEHERLKTLIQTDTDLSELLMRAFILRRLGLLAEGYGDVVVIGSVHSTATLRIQAFLLRNGHPYRYVDVDRDPSVQSLFDHFLVGVEDVPVLICRGERVLKSPTNAEVAECLGFNPKLDAGVVYDLVICGAGPGGLAAAVYAASEGLNVLILEADAPGGQAASSSKIENYLGFPTGVSGQALTARALNQAEKFGAKLAVASGAIRLLCNETPMRVELAGGEAVHARAIVIATGADYRRLDVAGLERFEGLGVYYAATYVEAQRCTDEQAVVVGGGNSAGQAATFLARSSQHVHVVIRGPDLAASMSRYLIRRIEETPNITLHRRTRIVGVSGGEHLETITWHNDATGETVTQPIRHVFSMTGARPNTDWLRGCVAMDKSGFVLTGPDIPRELLAAARWPLERQPLLFETTRPRVFAVGDVRANSVKRVASAVGEGSVCIQLVHKVLAD